MGDAGPLVLKKKPATTARQSTKQTDERHHIAFQAHRLRKPLHGKWRIAVDAAIAGRANFLHGMNQLFRFANLTHYAVDIRALKLHYFSSSEVYPTGTG